MGQKVRHLLSELQVFQEKNFNFQRIVLLARHTTLKVSLMFRPLPKNEHW